MEKYLFKLNRELLDVNAIEMDKTLSKFFQEMSVGSDETFEMINDQGFTRKFRIHWEDNTLQGRGIKGFFSPYNADSLLIEKTESDKIRVSAPIIPTKGKTQNQASRPELVMNALSGFKQDSETWFQLYQKAQSFQADSNDDQLICLPYIREAETFQYQLNTVKSVIHRFKGRVMLSDEVGLGKTVEAGMTMLEYIMRGLVKKNIDTYTSFPCSAMGK